MAWHTPPAAFLIYFPSLWEYIAFRTFLEMRWKLSALSCWKCLISMLSLLLYQPSWFTPLHFFPDPCHESDFRMWRDEFCLRVDWVLSIRKLSVLSSDLLNCCLRDLILHWHHCFLKDVKLRLNCICVCLNVQYDSVSQWLQPDPALKRLFSWISITGHLLAENQIAECLECKSFNATPFPPLGFLIVTGLLKWCMQLLSSHNSSWNDLSFMHDNWIESSRV